MTKPSDTPRTRKVRRRSDGGKPPRGWETQRAGYDDCPEDALRRPLQTALALPQTLPPGGKSPAVACAFWSAWLPRRSLSTKPSTKNHSRVGGLLTNGSRGLCVIGAVL